MGLYRAAPALIRAINDNIASNILQRKRKSRRPRILEITDGYSQQEFEHALYLECIGIRIAQTRRSLNLTQQQMSEHFSTLHQTYLSAIEQGAVDLKLSTILKIATFFKVSPRRLLPTENELKWMAYVRGASTHKRLGPGLLTRRPYTRIPNPLYFLPKKKRSRA